MGCLANAHLVNFLKRAWTWQLYWTLKSLNCMSSVLISVQAIITNCFSPPNMDHGVILGKNRKDNVCKCHFQVCVCVRKSCKRLNKAWEIGTVLHEALWSVKAAPLDGNQAWQGYQSLQTQRQNGISGTNEVCVTHITKKMPLMGNEHIRLHKVMEL